MPLSGRPLLALLQHILRKGSGMLEIYGATYGQTTGHDRSNSAPKSKAEGRVGGRRRQQLHPGLGS